VSDALFNIFVLKMAGVFIISTCTIGLRTAIFPRWIMIIGCARTLVLLLVISNWKGITFVFPLCMLLAGTYMLFAEFRSQKASYAQAKQLQLQGQARVDRKTDSNARTDYSQYTATCSFERTRFLLNACRL